MEERRLYIGGLSDTILEKDIKKKFSEFGSIGDVELRCKENYGNKRYFAYINIRTDKGSLDNCVRTCNNLEWKGGILKVQLAKESPLQTVQRDVNVNKVKLQEAETSTKRATKSRAKNRKDSSDESGDEPQTHLGVPAWKGFKSHVEAASPSTSKLDLSEKNTKPKSEKVHERSTPRVQKRLYIGGLPETALDGDIKARFSEFGNVKNVEIKCKENHGNKRFFAYIDLDTDESKLDQCIRDCNNQTWRGAQLKVQIAKESFLQRAQNEILERKGHSGENVSQGYSKTVKNDHARGTNEPEEPMDFTNSAGTDDDPKREAWEHQGNRKNIHQQTARKDWREASNRNKTSSNVWDRSRASDEYPRDYDQRRPGRSRIGEVPKRSAGDTFESEKNGLFDEIDAADEIGLEQEELLSEDDGDKAEPTDEANDPLSEKNLKELFDQDSESKGFTLSSLFADQLTVEEPLFLEGEMEPSTRKSRGEAERFEEEYWKRAEKVDQRPWHEMVHRNNRNSFTPRASSSFFILPGDKRLEEGAEVFRTDVDPAQFVDCWRDQAEHLTQRLLQRKRNTRVQYQMMQRSLGMSKQSSKKKKLFRKQIKGEDS